MKTSRRWSFLIKCFTRSFPLGVTCLLCLPSLYQDICCPSCFDTSIIEDWAHLFTCSKLQASWESLEKNCRATMTSFIAELTAKFTRYLPHPGSPTNYIESLWTNSFHMDLRKMMTEGKITCFHINMLAKQAHIST